MLVPLVSFHMVLHDAVHDGVDTIVYFLELLAGYRRHGTR